MSGGRWLDEESTAALRESARQQLDCGTARRARYEVADPEHRFLDHRLAAAGQGVDAGQQFRKGKRLYDVIVVAGAQALHPIIGAASALRVNAGPTMPSSRSR